SYLSARRFRRILLESPTVRDIVELYLERMLNASRQAAGCNAIHHVEHRLCRSLLEAMDRVESSELPFTQDVLSRMLGVRRTTVTLVLKLPEQRRLIDNPRGRIPVGARDKLEAAACECYRIRSSGGGGGITDLGDWISGNPDLTRPARQERPAPRSA